MYLIILSKYGDPLLVLNTRKHLDVGDAASLIWRLQTQWSDSVGVLSNEKYLADLPRFSNGELKQESVPKQLRNEALFDFIHGLSKIALKQPPAKTRAPAFTSSTAPRRQSLISPEQVAQVQHLLGSGLKIRQVSTLVGISKSSIHRIGAAGSNS